MALSAPQIASIGDECVDHLWRMTPTIQITSPHFIVELMAQVFSGYRKKLGFSSNDMS
jgi:hypothetical protein